MGNCLCRGAISAKDEDSHSSRGAIPSVEEGSGRGRSSSRGAIGFEDEDNGSGSSSSLSLSSFVSTFNPRPLMASKNDFVRMQDHGNCYWVYAAFSESERFLALDIYENTYVRLPNHHMITGQTPASTVSDGKLFVIGGTTSQSFQFFDPVLINWSQTYSTIKTRDGAVAASIDGKVCVFGGHERRLDDWGEVYDVSANKWTPTPIPASEVLNEENFAHLFPLLTSAVLGKKIIMRGFGNGIAFDVMSNSWTRVSQDLMSRWRDLSTAAVVQNMLITSDVVDGQLSIGAYDPDQDVWLKLQGIDPSFHENASRSKFMAVNGKLVIYHIGDENDLRFSIIEINEKLRTTVKVSLLRQSRFPIATIIEPRNYSILQGVNVISRPTLLQPLRS